MTEKKEQIISCIGNLNYKSIKNIFGVSAPYISALKKRHNIPSFVWIAENQLQRRTYTPQISLKYIILNYFDITNAQLMSKSRKRNLVYARMFYVNYLVHAYPLTWEKLGLEVNRDHATAIHYLKKMKNELFYDDIRKIKEDLDLIIRNN